MTLNADSSAAERPVALVTGASRSAGIGAAVVAKLAETGWNVGFTYLSAYDARMPWGAEAGGPDEIRALAGNHGARTRAIEIDLSNPDAPAEAFDVIDNDLGPVTALVLCHCESVNSGLLDTSIDSFDRHFAVNARASWLLIREYARRFRGPHGTGRIVALTSDATVGNLPYGASKGALDRITLAAARELAHLGVTANAINPGPTDTGWMTADLKTSIIQATPLGRLGQPGDCASLVAFLCSPGGGWINGQLLHSDGGFC